METIGNLIDKLSVVTIRIWMVEDVKRDSNTSNEQIAKMTALLLNWKRQEKKELRRQKSILLKP
jgi:hypothetical protein